MVRGWFNPRATNYRSTVIRNIIARTQSAVNWKIKTAKNSPFSIGNIIHGFNRICIGFNFFCEQYALRANNKTSTVWCKYHFVQRLVKGSCAHIVYGPGISAVFRGKDYFGGAYHCKVVCVEPRYIPPKRGWAVGYGNCLPSCTSICCFKDHVIANGDTGVGIEKFDSQKNPSTRMYRGPSKAIICRF